LPYISSISKNFSIAPDEKLMSYTALELIMVEWLTGMTVMEQYYS